MTSPSERLLMAAEILEKRANEAASPWKLDDDNHLGLLSIVTPAMIGTRIQTSSSYSFTGPNDATTRYIATMHPEVGKALAALLGHAGRLLAAKEDVYQLAADAGRENFDGFFGYSLMLADLVLAGEQEQARG